MRCGARNSHSGVTLVELILVLVLIGLLAGSSVGLAQHALHTIFYLPNSTRVVHAGGDVFDAAIEGSISTATNPAIGGRILRGIRYAEQFSIATPTQCRFVNVDGDDIWLLSIVGVFARVVMLGGVFNFNNLDFIPYENTASIPFSERIISLRTWPDTGQVAFFRYYDGNGNLLPATVPPGQRNQIRRVELGAVIQTGSGLVGETEARIEPVSSVTIRTCSDGGVLCS